jgi:hypothetical protein
MEVGLTFEPRDFQSPGTSTADVSCCRLLDWQALTHPLLSIVYIHEIPISILSCSGYSNLEITHPWPHPEETESHAPWYETRGSSYWMKYVPRTVKKQLLAANQAEKSDKGWTITQE